MWLVRTLRLPTLSRTCPPFDYQVGDWLLGSNPWKLQYWLVPGTWEHGAIIVAPGVVAEFTHHGYTFTALSVWRKQYTRALVLRPQYKDRQVALKRLEAFWGVPYDEEFARGPEKVYCFELLTLMAPEIRVEWTGKLDTLKGDDIERSPDVEVVFDSRRT